MRKSPIFDAAVYPFLRSPNRVYVAEIVRFRISGDFGICSTVWFPSFEVRGSRKFRNFRLDQLPVS